MVLLETCTDPDCGFAEQWEGGTAAEDPGVEHARETGHEVKTRVVDDETDLVECEHCGTLVPEDEVVAGAGSLTQSGAARLAEGQTVSADELFAFDQPYCSLGCMSDDGGRDE